MTILAKVTLTNVKKDMKYTLWGARVAIEWLPRPHKNTPTEFYMKKKPQKAQNIAV